MGMRIDDRIMGDLKASLRQAHPRDSRLDHVREKVAASNLRATAHLKEMMRGFFPPGLDVDAVPRDDLNEEVVAALADHEKVRRTIVDLKRLKSTFALNSFVSTVLPCASMDFWDRSADVWHSDNPQAFTNWLYKPGYDVDAGGHVSRVYFRAAFTEPQDASGPTRRDSLILQFWFEGSVPRDGSYGVGVILPVAAVGNPPSWRIDVRRSLWPFGDVAIGCSATEVHASVNQYDAGGNLVESVPHMFGNINDVVPFQGATVGPGHRSLVSGLQQSAFGNAGTVVLRGGLHTVVGVSVRYAGQPLVSGDASVGGGVTFDSLFEGMAIWLTSSTGP